MSNTEKTTYQHLSTNSRTGFNALISGVSLDEKAALYQPTSSEIGTYTTAAIGQYWLGQGGYYAGIMRDGDEQWHLIDSGNSFNAAWGIYRYEISGEFSARDGRRNTNLILAAEPENEIASHCTALLIDGHKDFYWPSQCENNLLFVNLPEHLPKKSHWSSTKFCNTDSWMQNFDEGSQFTSLKCNVYAARAVRRIPI